MGASSKPTYQLSRDETGIQVFIEHETEGSSNYGETRPRQKTNGSKASFGELFNTLETLFLSIWLFTMRYRSSGSVE